jgi:beta-glucanase (GH16 family)
MRERRPRAGLVVLLVVVLATAAALVAVELRTGSPFGHGRHDDDEWQVVFDEEFDGDDLDRERWNTCHWWDEDGCTIASNDELQWYLPSQVSQGNGRLSLTAEEGAVDASDGERYPYRSGMVTTGPPVYQADSRFDFTYGRVEARVRAPGGAGLWSAVWLLPSTSESRPEIDILELLGNDPTEWIFHFHPKDRDRQSDGHRTRGPNLSTGWHDVGLDWEPGRLRWFIDGREVWRVEGDHVPDEPMYLVANLAVGGVYPGAPAEDTEFPATFEIDRMTVWQRPA